MSVAAMLELACGIQQQRVNAASQPNRRTIPHSCGVDRHDEVWRAGYLAGVSACVAIETGEKAADVQMRVEVEIGCAIDAAAKAPVEC